MTPLRMTEDDFNSLPDGKKLHKLFEVITMIAEKVDDICAAKRSFKRLAIKWGSISGGGLAVAFLLIHDPRSPVGKIACSLLKVLVGG